MSIPAILKHIKTIRDRKALVAIGKAAKDQWTVLDVEILRTLRLDQTITLNTREGPITGRVTNYSISKVTIETPQGKVWRASLSLIKR